jgi:hypothetical protein
LEIQQKVDGHDVGSGETNIFIITADPVRTFRQSMAVLERTRCSGAVTAAHRRVDSEEYTVVWPEDTAKDFRVV